MAKIKYTRFGDKAQGYECTNKKCKWQGLDNEKQSKKLQTGWTELVCSNCGNNEFYGLIEKPTNNEK